MRRFCENSGLLWSLSEDSKIGKCIDYLTNVSSEYLTSRLSLHIYIDNVLTILSTSHHMHHCNYAATEDMVKCFICTTVL